MWVVDNLCQEYPFLDYQHIPLELPENVDMRMVEVLSLDTLIIVPSVKTEQLWLQSIGRVIKPEDPIIIWINVKNRVARNHFKI